MSDKLESLRIEVQRQDGPGMPPRWESYRRDARKLTTVADLLDSLTDDPTTTEGKRVAPIVWASACTFPVCGSCAMLVNGRAALACATKLSEVGNKGRLRLAPLSKFPLYRDLWVDTSRMASAAKRLVDWHEPPEQEIPTGPALRAALSRCTDCGCCVEACPETSPQRAFVGPAAIAAAHSAALLEPKPARIRALLMPGGIDDCGRSESCVEVCPEGIPLDESLGWASRAASRMWWRTLFGGAD
jgi:succinate dehydrogenase / fumarate reductase iron-sulfur subunit